MLGLALAGRIPFVCTLDNRSGFSRILCTSSSNAWFTATLALALVSANRHPNFCASLWPSSLVTSLFASCNHYQIPQLHLYISKNCQAAEDMEGTHESHRRPCNTLYAQLLADFHRICHLWSLAQSCGGRPSESKSQSKWSIDSSNHVVNAAQVLFYLSDCSKTLIPLYLQLLTSGFASQAADNTSLRNFRHCYLCAPDQLCCLWLPWQRPPLYCTSLPPSSIHR